MTKKKKLRHTKIQKNYGNVSKMLEETFLQSYLKNYVQVHLDKSRFKRKVLLDLVCLLFFFSIYLK